MRRILVVLSAITMILLGSSATSIAANQPQSDGDTKPQSAPQSQSGRHAKDFLDTRKGTLAQQLSRAQDLLQGSAAGDVKRLTASVGPGAEVAIDPSTGTPKNVSSEDGYLTGPSSATPASVALGFVKGHLSQLGVSASDMSTFDLRSSYADDEGTTHLSWQQLARGIPVFGNGLKAHVDKQGRLISIQGSPISGLERKAQAAKTSPELTATLARLTAAKDVGGSVDTVAKKVLGGILQTTTWKNGDTAGLVWFSTKSGVALGWNTYTQAGNQKSYAHVVNAVTGKVLYRKNLVSYDDGDAQVFDNYPGAKKGGKAKTVNFISKNWLSPTATWLQGTNVWAWSDFDDDDLTGGDEKTPIPTTANTTLVPFFTNPFCSASVCTWDPELANSWQTNRTADTSNAFYLANNFHDYLAKSPIGFTPASGNFEGVGGDQVLLQTMDGANSDNGLPDADHVDNANMSTPPDGTPPTMQMYLWHQPGSDNVIDPFVPTTGGFDASILYHEYTHGLSNRLVVDATGNSTLIDFQANSMGEAWSDYYAMDYLVSKGLEKNTSKSGEVLEAKYIIPGQLFRTEAIDCPVTSHASNCTRQFDGFHGGYTYGNLPDIGGGPEVHASGEVWAQTLWDIRNALGRTKADRIITNGMRLSAEDPSMLDMRNAILQADKVSYDSDHRSKLWSIFAKRGMGWFAGSLDSGDTDPIEDFHKRPSNRNGTLAGTVTDGITGAPVEGAVVRITGHDSGLIGNYSAATDAAGHYSITKVPTGTYSKVVVSADGYELFSGPVRVKYNGPPNDFTIRKDYAAASGGGTITGFDGIDFSDISCGPDGAIDLSQVTGWSSTTGPIEEPTDTPTPKAITLKLSEPIDIGTDATHTAFAIDPTSTCGDDESSSTAAYTIEVSINGTTWQTVVDGTGANKFTADDNFQYNNVPASAAVNDVQYVRFTMKSPQVENMATNCPDGGFSGCLYMDVTEIEVFGTPST